MIRERDTIVLDDDLPEHGLKRGDLGAVVLVHPGERGYEVEFVALDGGTVALVALSPSQVRPIGHREIAHARAVESGVSMILEMEGKT